MGVGPETFLNKRAVEMCEHIKRRYPHVYLYTSTNGLAFTDDRVRRLARSGIDEVTFSIDGATPETYARYRQRGDLNLALRHLRLIVEEKQRASLDVPFINWRYILFQWNDSDEEMNLARRLAADIGVGRLTWEVTDHPEDAFSRRFVPGTPHHEAIRHEIWDDNNLGNAIPGATPKARIEVAGRAGLPMFGLVSRPLRLRARVHNLSSRPFPAQASYGLKFDLVSEGIDWFEACGSPTLTRTLIVA